MSGVCGCLGIGEDGSRGGGRVDCGGNGDDDDDDDEDAVVVVAVDWWRDGLVVAIAAVDAARRRIGRDLRSWGRVVVKRVLRIGIA